MKLDSLLRTVLAACLLGASGLWTLGSEAIPIEQALKDGKVKAEVKGLGGSTGDAIQITVQRQAQESFRLALAPGTVFKSVTGRAQNMVAACIKGERVGDASYRPASEIVLNDDGPHTFIIEAYCLDFHKENPGPNDHFRLSASDERALKVLQAGKKAGVSIARIQSALWIDREGISPVAVKERFPVTDGDIEAARELLRTVRKSEIGAKQPNEASVPIKAGDTVRVTGGAASVMDGKEILATFDDGKEFKAAKVQGDWVGLWTQKAGKEYLGWIQKRHLQVVPSTITETVAVPPAVSGLSDKEGRTHEDNASVKFISARWLSQYLDNDAFPRPPSMRYPPPGSRCLAVQVQLLPASARRFRAQDFSVSALDGSAVKGEAVNCIPNSLDSFMTPEVIQVSPNAGEIAILFILPEKVTPTAFKWKEAGAATPIVWPPATETQSIPKPN